MPQQLRFQFPSTSQLKHFRAILSKKEKFFLYLAIFILLTSLITWGVSYYLSSTQKVPTIGGEYTEGILGQPLYINPIISQSNEVDSALCQLIFSSLLSYNNEGNLVNDLAQDFEISEDGKRYTFHLKESVKWHDKTDLTAQDVIFTVALIQNQSFNKSLRGDWQDIKASAPDQRTVVFELPKPYAPFPNKATFGILPRHIFEQIPNDKFLLSDFNLKPVGSGPFQYSEFKQDSENNIVTYQLLANRDYFGDKPFLEKIAFNFYQDEDSLFNAYEKKEINGFGVLSYGKVDALKQRKDTDIHTINTSRYFAIFLNQTKSVPLANKDVRLALQHAINRDAIVEEVFSGFASKNHSPLLVSFGELSPQETHGIREYNPSEAERILEEAGWKKEGDGIRKKDDVTLEFSLITTKWADLVKTAEIVKSQLEQIGVKVNVTNIEFSDIQQNFIKPREYQSILFGQEYFGNDPDPYYFWHSSGKKDPGFNIAVYDNEEVDNLLQEARETRDDGQRKEKYLEFEQKINDDAPAIFLYSPMYVHVTNKKIKGLETQAVVDPSYRFENTNHWFIKTTRVKKD
ncbi:MAG: peptide ABC transporter substrate-binding protein [Patescibacteria group bacterium]|nr:peptide ABC transporter substrate-binding protein [Patescibacteria group bacterium]